MSKLFFLPIMFVSMSLWAQERSNIVNTTAYDPSCGVALSLSDSDIKLSWPLTGDRMAYMIFQKHGRSPLVKSMGIMQGEKTSELFNNLDPQYVFWRGKRDLKKRHGWTIFFDRPDRRSFSLEKAMLDFDSVRVSSTGRRCTLTIHTLRSPSFEGTLNFIFYPGSKLIRMEAAVSTKHDSVAYLYSTGLIDGAQSFRSICWDSPLDGFQRVARNEVTTGPQTTAFRTIIAESEKGTLAVFPPPHQFLYPLDFADNYGYNWAGDDYLDMFTGFALGVRQPPYGDRRWVPWMNAPPGTVQRLGCFLLLDDQRAERVLEDVKKYTHNDQYPDLPGYKKFTSHYHVEHALDYLEKQTAQGTEGIPQGLENPDFVKVFKEMGVDMVHLAEFHVGETPGLDAERRLKQLKVMHDECKRLSTDDFLLIPGEEPNVHLGGHWISLFPKPVNWVLNRPEGQPFYKKDKEYGEVYQVGNKDEVLELFKRENGLMWTAHPRIKGSTNFPDEYKKEEFFASDHFLGAAWKAMPADLSKPYLGDDRVLGLLNDMTNWGHQKYVVGEVDVFKVNKGYELYGAMNMNYLKMDDVPDFADGWQPVLDVLRSGDYFVTTGEVIIQDFDVNGVNSGGNLKIKRKKEVTIHARLSWTFPMHYINVIMGNGETVTTKRIDLHETSQFGSKDFSIPVEVGDATWIRFEAWDVAANGAFTQPVRLVK